MSVTSASDDAVVPAARLAVEALVPAASKALRALDKAIRRSTVDAGLLDLARLRASQINGSAYGVDVFGRDALAAGETERRVIALPVWREAPFFTARERAALELTEAMTRLADGAVPDELVSRVATRFCEQELAELIWAITVVNAWNRLDATARPWPLV